MSKFISDFSGYTSVISVDYLFSEQALVKNFKWDTKMFTKTFYNAQFTLTCIWIFSTADWL